VTTSFVARDGDKLAFSASGVFDILALYKLDYYYYFFLDVDDRAKVSVTVICRFSTGSASGRLVSFHRI